jgi:hypothetical protein
MDKNMEDLQKDSTEDALNPMKLVAYMYKGHIKIFDPESGEVYIDKRNAIHYENISEAIAYNLANKGQSYISTKCILVMVAPV